MIEACQSLGSLDKIAATTKFSIKATVDILEDRWKKLLFDPEVAKYVHILSILHSLSTVHPLLGFAFV